jgi:hypothetical protein
MVPSSASRNLAMANFPTPETLLRMSTHEGGESFSSSCLGTPLDSLEGILRGGWICRIKISPKKANPSGGVL